MFSHYSIYSLPVQYCTIIMIDVISLTRQTWMSKVFFIKRTLVPAISILNYKHESVESQKPNNVLYISGFLWESG